MVAGRVNHGVGTFTELSEEAAAEAVKRGELVPFVDEQVKVEDGEVVADPKIAKAAQAAMPGAVENVSAAEGEIAAQKVIDDTAQRVNREQLERAAVEGEDAEKAKAEADKKAAAEKAAADKKAKADAAAAKKAGGKSNA